ncbi:MAG: HEPN domain-containing protein [Nanoarchaeota archaeon]
MIKTREVGKGMYLNYLRKAEEFYDAMKTELEKKNYNSCVLCAIHCCISASDALTVFYKGVRHLGEKHQDVIRLLNELSISDIKTKTRHLSNVLDIKNSLEYEEKLTTESGALAAVKSTERLFLWIKGLLKE